VALPVSIAYAQLAGFDPVVGLYSSILPLVAYAIFGTSRQLMVNPDAAACAMIAAAIAPLAGNSAELYLSLTTALTLLTGLFCITASYFRLGALADFLSKPILVGFLNGVAISIFLGQIGKLLGFSVESAGIIPRLLEVLGKIPLIHGATLAVGLGSFALLLACVRWLPRLPAALAVLVVAGAATAVLELDSQGVTVLGPVPAGLPQLRWPTVPLQDVPSLAAAAAGLALVVFTSGTLTARSFAAKGGYRIDVDREFAAFGAANISSALSQGFAVTGADSRTAVGVAAGGRTQVSGLVAATTIAAVLLFLTEPLQYVPVGALGAVLVFAAFSLFDVSTLREIWKYDRLEVGLSLITTLGVVAAPECESRPAARLRLLFREISAELSKLPRPLQKPPLPLLLFFCGRRRVSELIDLLACKVDGLRCGFRASPLHELRSCQPQLDKPTDGLGAVRFIGLPRCPSVHIFTQFGRKPDCRHWVSPSGRPASLFSHYVFA
jgi:MFS superfamily sulfate permease-like transporter